MFPNIKTNCIHVYKSFDGNPFSYRIKQTESVKDVWKTLCSGKTLGEKKESCIFTSGIIPKPNLNWIVPLPNLCWEQITETPQGLGDCSICDMRTARRDRRNAERSARLILTSPSQQLLSSHCTHSLYSPHQHEWNEHSIPGSQTELAPWALRK